MKGKASFFQSLERQYLAVTYADVRLKTGQSNVLPHQVDISSRFSRRVPLKIPIVSAAMDTVTERSMAIALAKCGGLGIIHRGLSPKDQAKQVTKVKLCLNGFINKPITVLADQTIAQVENRRADKGYTFHSFPVIDDAGKVIGVLTRNDFDFAQPDQSVAEVMTKEVVTSYADTDIQTASDIMRQRKIKVLPLVDANGVLAGMYVASDLKRIMSADSQLYNTDEYNRLRVGAAIGTGGTEIERAILLIKAGVDVLVIDTAHGDTTTVVDTLGAIKLKYDIDIVVGNVSEPESVKRLIAAGADGIKVGQGGGSICTTRIVAGVGCPQVSAIYSCARAANGSRVPICADGGITHSGDIPIAIGAGAHCVMLGRLLAGAEEAPGEPVIRGGVVYKCYRGMGSLAAMKASTASRERYQQNNPQKLVPEGIEGAVPYDGPVEQLLVQYIGGLRAGMGYVGAEDIEMLREIARFHRVTSAGVIESHPHDVTITEDAPNYRSR